MTPDLVRARIIELVPDAYTRSQFTGSDPYLTLADVLRAMQKVRSQRAIGIDYNGGFLNCDDDMNNLTTSDTCWNLTNDYDGQTQEVKDFVGKLIGVTSNTVT